ncbi:class I SAM-dependent methyltransferase [Roseivirga sp. BDSF3-8]|uniref:class I SAM-dependent methyltransferase n=1 Tax=Roseivirga sp. BDSF3-8 TaxID=3241598 RepID=UPI003531D125
MNYTELNHELGNIDIYLLDAILKGYFPQGTKLLDAGCGEGRNLFYFLKNGYECYGTDVNESALRMLRFQINSVAPGYPTDRFTSGDLTQLPYQDAAFDAVLCIAVLHFAENEEHFRKMFSELVRVLRPAGRLLIRMTDNTAMDKAEHIGEGKYSLPDGSIRFLMTPKLLSELIDTYSLNFAEPGKSLVVSGMRSMNILMLAK